MDKKNIADLFNQQGAQLGLDPDSSSIIINNLNASTMPMCQGSPFTDDEEGTDDFRIIFFAVDGSSSMEEVENEVRDGFNNIIIPCLLGGALDLVGGIRIGGLMFGSRVSPLWGGGFQPIQQLPKLGNDYSTSGMTCLHQGILDSLTAITAYSLQLANITGTMPEVTFAVLSDGANNQPPMDHGDVYNVLSKVSPEIFTTVFIGFETFEAVNFRAIAKALGFREIQDLKKQNPNETLAETQQRFRHMFKVFSQRLTKRVSSSMVGQTAEPDGSTGFFD